MTEKVLNGTQLLKSLKELRRRGLIVPEFQMEHAIQEDRKHRKVYQVWECPRCPEEPVESETRLKGGDCSQGHALKLVWSNPEWTPEWLDAPSK